MKKYRLTGEKKKVLIDKWVYRIQALRDFDDVKAGDLGGWIAGERNLSRGGKAWVYDDSAVVERGIVRHNGKVRGYSIVFDQAKVTCSGEVRGNCILMGKSHVYGHASVSGNVLLNGDIDVLGKARLSGRFELACYANISGEAKITTISDVLSVGPIGSRWGITTFYRNKKGGISVNCGCFEGTIDEFLDKVDRVHGETKHGKDYHAAARFAKISILGGDE